MEIHDEKIGWDIELAKTLKSLTDTGQQSIGANVGYVIKQSPLSIKMYGGNLIIQSNIHEMYVGENLKNSGINQGQRVLVIADSDNTVFFVVDGITRVGG